MTYVVIADSADTRDLITPRFDVSFENHNFAVVAGDGDIYMAWHIDAVLDFQRKDSRCKRDIIKAIRDIEILMDVIKFSRCTGKHSRNRTETQTGKSGVYRCTVGLANKNRGAAGAGYPHDYIDIHCVVFGNQVIAAHVVVDEGGFHAGHLAVYRQRNTVQ